HRCAKRQFLLLLVDDEVVSPDDGTAADLVDPGPGEEVIAEHQHPPTDSEHFHLSTAALRGPPSPRTLRLEGRINELQ
ncbi:hypothetical protein A2U01_0087607, partial [Trifolium medium]|nr:hypothetical protein [Trifolium medium]